MNKSELVAAVAEKADMTQKGAAKIISAFTAVISEAIHEGEEVRIAGFGTFKVRHRVERTGRNPRTGEALKISAKKVPVFKPGKMLKST